MAVMNWIVFPTHNHPNSYVEALIVDVTVFGNRSFKEVVKIKWDHKGGALIQ